MSRTIKKSLLQEKIAELIDIKAPDFGADLGEYDGTDANITGYEAAASDDDGPQHHQQRSGLRAKAASTVDDLSDSIYSATVVNKSDLNGGMPSQLPPLSDDDIDDDEEDASDLDSDVDNKSESGDGTIDGSEIEDVLAGDELDNELDSNSEIEVPKFKSTTDVDDSVKGKALLSQIKVYDQVLAFRIKLQKMVQLANRLPQTDKWEELNVEECPSLRNARMQVRKLLNVLVAFDEALIASFPGSKSILSDTPNTKMETNDDDEEIDSDLEEEISSHTGKIGHPAAAAESSPSQAEDLPSESDSDDDETKLESEKPKKRKQLKTCNQFEQHVAKRFRSMKSFQDGALVKWHDRTSLATAKVGKRFEAFDQNVLKQIELTLSDQNRLLRRTQLQRSEYSIVGKEDENDVIDAATTTEEDLTVRRNYLKTYDGEIFDDDDFYQQLLRELIERKTQDVVDPNSLGRQWLEIQKLRSKLKRKVDTKASKGRKIRYDVHKRLVNFMAPNRLAKMSESAVSDLYASLFGKMSSRLVNPSVDISLDR